MNIDDEQGKQEISWKIISQFLKNNIRITKMIWRQKKGQIIGIFFIYFGISISPFLIAFFRGLLIDELVLVGGAGISSGIIIYLSALIVSTWLPSIFHTLQMYFEKFIYFFISEKFEILTLKKRGDIDIAIHEDPKMNDLFNKISDKGTYMISNSFTRQFDIFRDIVGVIFASIIIISYEWWILIIILVFSIPEFIISSKYGYQIWAIQGVKGETRRKFYNFRQHFFGISSLTELKLFQNIKHFLSIIRDLFIEFQNEEKKAEKKRLKQKSIALILSALSMGFTVVWFVYGAANGLILVGTLTFIISSLGNLRSSFMGLFGSLGKQYEDALFVNDFFEFLDIKPVVERPKKGIVLSSKKTPEIVFENVNFKYPGTERFVLKDFSIRIAPGEKIALVGINGSGKTTFVKLLCRFYDPDEGRILIDGNDLKDIDLESWYKIMGALFQDYDKYHLIVREAISVGRTNKKSKIEKIKMAAKASEADIFIEEWEDRYEQMLGKSFRGGIEPSIGQWQKLALARTFYRDPQVLILDEPTSSIDAEAEEKIFKKLESLPKDRTVILISHRFSTVRRANRIAVIENGKLLELGSHTELIKANKTYARLFNLQAKGYE